MSKNINSIIKKIDGMKKKIYKDNTDSFEVAINEGYNQALEDTKPIIEREIKELLNGLKREIRYNDTEKGGYNKRESELRERIDKIIE